MEGNRVPYGWSASARGSGLAICENLQQLVKSGRHWIHPKMPRLVSKAAQASEQRSMQEAIQADWSMQEAGKPDTLACAELYRVHAKVLTRPSVWSLGADLGWCMSGDQTHVAHNLPVGPHRVEPLQPHVGCWLMYNTQWTLSIAYWVPLPMPSTALLPHIPHCYC